MSFISYAQNFEDIMLWRALKHIESGFYIDVGAWSPDLDSVTKAFYDRGWCGINVEPNPEFIHEYKEKRPRDFTLCAAVSDKPGTATIYFGANSGLSSLDRSVVEKNLPSDLELNCASVTVTTLLEIGQRYAANKDVHFLKIDVEGLEKEVIQGNDWSLLRPWVVLVEATAPMSKAESHSAWEAILLDADYTFAYADGLNRFYIANENAELLKVFDYPPNVFDDFITSRQLQMDAYACNREAHARDQEARALRAQEELRQVYASRSWRCTRPFRELMAVMRKLRVSKSDPSRSTR